MLVSCVGLLCGLQSPLVLSSRFVESMFVMHGVRSHAEYATAVAEVDATASDSGGCRATIAVSMSADAVLSHALFTVRLSQSDS